jgi:hypothetical protein
MRWPSAHIPPTLLIPLTLRILPRTHPGPPILIIPVTIKMEEAAPTRAATTRIQARAIITEPGGISWRGCPPGGRPPPTHPSHHNYLILKSQKTC